MTTLESRSAFTEALVEQEDWLYMEAGDDVPAAEMHKRLAELKAVGQPMVTRAQVGQSENQGDPEHRPTPSQGSGQELLT